ncbi:partial Exodeoxyribonuclease, partial [uncultured bacterium]
IGWRLDYFIVSPELKPVLKEAVILADVMGSDHCPVGIELALDLSKPYSGSGS